MWWLFCRIPKPRTQDATEQEHRFYVKGQVILEDDSRRWLLEETYMNLTR
jgi:hypothetical protein